MHKEFCDFPRHADNTRRLKEMSSCYICFRLPTCMYSHPMLPRLTNKQRDEMSNPVMLHIALSLRRLHRRPRRPCHSFQETKRPSKEMQVTIARQLGLDPSTVSNFFMNARRRSVDKWKDERALLAAGKSVPAGADSDDDFDDIENDGDNDDNDFDDEEEIAADSPQPQEAATRTVFVTDGEQQFIGGHAPQQQHQQQQQLILVKASTGQFIQASPAAVVQHLAMPGGCGGDLTPTSLGSAASLDL